MTICNIRTTSDISKILEMLTLFFMGFGYERRNIAKHGIIFDPPVVWWSMTELALIKKITTDEKLRPILPYENEQKTRKQGDKKTSISPKKTQKKGKPKTV